DYQFDFSIKVKKNVEGVCITVSAFKLFFVALEGKAGFNLEFLSFAYFHKSFMMEERTGIFPRYPSGPKEINGLAEARPLATGKHLVLAPDDIERRVSIQTFGEPLELYDGRSKAQNGWFI